MRKLKLAVLRTAKRLGLFDLARKSTAKGIRILCYHGIWLGTEGWPGDAMFMARTSFERRLGMLKSLGYPVIPLSLAVQALAGEAEVPPASIVITIDDGWYSTYAAMAPALAAHAMPATLYCDTAQLQQGLPIAHVMARYCRKLVDSERIGQAEETLFQQATDYLLPMPQRLAAASAFCRAIGVDPERYIAARVFDYMTPRELKEAKLSGLDIQLHTHSHSLGDMSDQRVQCEIDDNQQCLAKLLAANPTSFQHFCYPSGVTSKEAASTLARLGMASSTTTTAGIAFPGAMMQLLPRFLDGENVTPIEFEAEISGFMHFMRMAFTIGGAKRL